jgi:LCP family protein required for cell wall assembly
METQEHDRDVAARGRRVPGVVYAACSLLVPGAGQIAARRYVRGALMVLVAIALAVGLAMYVRGQSLGSLASDIVDRDVLIGVFVVNAVIYVLRAACVVDAYRLGRRGRRSVQALVLAGVLALAAVPHAAIALYDYDSYRTLNAVFPEEEPEVAVPFAPDSAYESDDDPIAATFEDTRGPLVEPDTPALTETASSRSTAAALGRLSYAPSAAVADRHSLAAPWERTGRVTILLLGGDRGPGRAGIRTDTMIVFTMNTKTKRTALFSVPRNLWGVPLPPAAAAEFGDTYDNLLNSLYPFALRHPEAFGGGRDPGATALKQVISNLVGIPIDYYALVDFAGFVDVVDALGGVDIDVPVRVLDRVSPATPGGAWIRIDLKPGLQHLTALETFAYVRARSQSSDYARIARQRCVLAAVAERANARRLLRNFRRLATTMRRSVGTDISLNSLPDLIELAAAVDTKRLVSIGFTPPTYTLEGNRPDIPRIRAKVRSVIDHPPATGATGTITGGACG